jgi:putative DNA primase/helicase
MRPTITCPAIAELMELPHWVVWRYESPGGKTTKVPYSAETGRHASSTNRATWSSYSVAEAAGPDYDGLGFVVTSTPYLGVDLDHCLDPDKRTLAPWAQAIVDRLRSYTEVTPSGRGVRVWVRGTLPPGGRKKGGLGPDGAGAAELYAEGRFFCVTGEHLAGTPDRIEPREVELVTIHRELFEPTIPPKAPCPAVDLNLDDTALLERARMAANGAAFASLWDGEDNRYPSRSEGDLALCAHLAFWTGRDATHIDRLFRASSRFRAKWDERHRGDGRTYGELTIAKAISGCRDSYTWCDPSAGSSNGASPPAGAHPDPWRHALPAPTLLAAEDAEPDFLVPHLLVRGAITEWFSPRGLGKTNVAHYQLVQLALAGLRVLLVDRDNPLREVKRRLKAWGAAMTRASTLLVVTMLHRSPMPPLGRRSQSTPSTSSASTRSMRPPRASERATPPSRPRPWPMCST